MAAPRRSSELRIGCGTKKGGGGRGEREAGGGAGGAQECKPVPSGSRTRWLLCSVSVARNRERKGVEHGRVWYYWAGAKASRGGGGGSGMRARYRRQQDQTEHTTKFVDALLEGQPFCCVLHIASLLPSSPQYEGQGIFVEVVGVAQFFKSSDLSGTGMGMQRNDAILAVALAVCKGVRVPQLFIPSDLFDDREGVPMFGST